jgi:hypothetical protein
VKLRIHGNELRLRLNQAEVAQFSKTGFVEESIEFGPGARLAFSLESLSDLKTPQALYQNGWIRIQIPGARATDWVTTDAVAIAGTHNLGTGKNLSILIEKDFKCLHSPEPQDPNAYPNPLEAIEEALPSPPAQLKPSTAVRGDALSEEAPPAKAG